MIRTGNLQKRADAGSRHAAATNPSICPLRATHSQVITTPVYPHQRVPSSVEPAADQANVQSY